MSEGCCNSLETLVQQFSTAETLSTPVPITPNVLKNLFSILTNEERDYVLRCREEHVPCSLTPGNSPTMRALSAFLCGEGGAFLCLDFPA